MHGGANAPGIAEHAKITVKLGRAAGRFFRIVRELHGRSAVDRRHLTDQRNRIEIGGAIRRASDEIVGQVGAPAKADADAAGEAAGEEPDAALAFPRLDGAAAAAGG